NVHAKLSEVKEKLANAFCMTFPCTGQRALMHTLELAVFYLQAFATFAFFVGFVAQSCPEDSLMPVGRIRQDHEDSPVAFCPIGKQVRKYREFTRYPSWLQRYGLSASFKPGRV